jgi:hypothetical protein
MHEAIKSKFPFWLLLIFLLISLSGLKSQVVYQHLSNKNIYHFIDELATIKIIEINSVIKPYSRNFIATKLEEAYSKKESLNKRQIKDLEFYLLEYKLELKSSPDYPPIFNKVDIFKKNPKLAFVLNPLGLHYKDSLLTVVVKPIWGMNYFINENGTEYHRWGGAEAHAYIGKHWGLYASLRDNNESKAISRPEYFTTRPGGAYKFTENGGGDYSEMRGGVTYAWKWGEVGLVKDHLNWGNFNHSPSILNDRAPSYAQIKLRIKPAKWFELNYIHGWLVSMVIDSSRSYYNNGRFREIYQPKYIAANMFTFTPWKSLNISIGNSIIYSDMNVHPAYLIPVMFYKSIDHTVNNGIDNQNSQMFFDISSRQIKHLHLYATLFVDELKIERFSEPDRYNFWSGKVGFKTSDLLIENLFLNFEYTMSMPITYEHRVPSLTYTSNNYNIGYYLQDNSDDMYISIGYIPLRGLHLTATYSLARHGEDFEYIIDGTVDTHPFMENVTWKNETYSIKASYEFFSNAYVFAEFIASDISGEEEQIEKYTPEFYHGKTNTISAGFNLGF